MGRAAHRRPRALPAPNLVNSAHTTGNPRGRSSVHRESCDGLLV